MVLICGMLGGGDLRELVVKIGVFERGKFRCRFLLGCVVFLRMVIMVVSGGRELERVVLYGSGVVCFFFFGKIRMKEFFVG